MNRVDNKIALVTGAARGIGRRAAECLAEAGATVVVTDIDEAGVAKTAGGIESAGGKALSLHHDVTFEEDWGRVVGEIESRYGRLDILVNNAGIFFYKSIEDTSLDDWRRITRVNLDGVFLGTKYAIGIMKKHPAEEGASRSIVNLSSVAGLVGGAHGGAYHMTKGGVRLFTKAAALECAALGYNIRVNSIHPAVIDTDMGDQVLADMAAANPTESIDALRENILSLHPLGRLGTVDDVAKAILFLASDDAAFITGTELVVDGGFTAR